MAMENNISKSTVAKKPFFIGAIGGIVSGFILMLTGLILSAISFFNRMNFQGWDVILIVAAFVFFAAGAHFLDSIDREKKSKKKQRFNL